LLAGTAADDEDRHTLRKRPRDRIHHVVTAGAVGDADDADAAGGARVAVGGEADAGLVRERYDAHAARPAALEEEMDDEVAGDAEEVGDADLLQVRDEEIADAHPRPHQAKNSSTSPDVTSSVTISLFRYTRRSTRSPARCAQRRS